MGTSWTIESVKAAIGTKKVSARELAAEHFQRIAARNGELNAYLTLSEERAYAQADRIDAAVTAGKPLPALAGVPIAALPVGVRPCPGLLGRGPVVGKRMTP